MPVIEPPVIATALAPCVAIEPNPRLVLEVATSATSERLLAIRSTPAADTYAATHPVGVYTFITLDVVLKYNAPVIKGLPSLSTVGSLALGPRYLSSKLSYAARAASLAASAAIADALADCAYESALDALVDAPEAEAADCAAYVWESIAERLALPL
jgi:hypothetical protein